MKVEIRGDNHDAPEYKEFEKQIDEYYEEKAKAENIGMPFSQPKPELSERFFMWKEGYISNKMLEEDYRYAIESKNKLGEDILSLCFYDGLAMVVKPTKELLEKLEKL